MASIHVRLLTDSPRPGEARLRIKCNGDIASTRAVVVDENGEERELMNVTGLAFKVGVSPDEPAEVTISILAPELEIDAGIAAAGVSALLEADAGAPATRRA